MKIRRLSLDTRIDSVNSHFLLVTSCLLASFPLTMFSLSSKSSGTFKLTCLTSTCVTTSTEIAC